MNILFSRFYPFDRTRETRFAEKILAGEKIHTIRRNFEHWKRFGGVECNLCYWADKPYRSKVVPFATRKIAVQKFSEAGYSAELQFRIAKNDGLTLPQMWEWFGVRGSNEFYEKCKDYAILYFTDFMYE